MIQPRRHGQWQRFVDSFDHEVSVKTTCHPLPVAFLVVGTLAIALVFHYVPLAREAIGLRDWLLPSVLVALGGAISIFGWWKYPDRNLVALSQFVDTSLYGAGKTERVIMATTGHRSKKMVRRYIREGNLFEDCASEGLL